MKASVAMLHQKTNSASPPQAHVVVVGASVSGCAAAILFARQGIPVTVIEKRHPSDFHKPICTHYIQPCSLTAWRELDLYEPLLEAGAVKNTIGIWTKWGWIPKAELGEVHALNMRRVTLDPLLRSKMINTPGVTYLEGTRCSALQRDASGAVTGVTVESATSGSFELPCTLLVGADGRESTVAELAGVPTEETPNQRFSCFTFFRNIPNESRTTSRMWMLEPYIAYQFPNDDGTTLIALMPTKDRVADFKADRAKCFREIVKSLPDAPDIDHAEQIADYLINTKNSMLLRRKLPHGLALVGDAFMTTDPLHGFGISWGIISASELVHRAAPGLLAGLRPDREIAAYHRERYAEVKGHFKIMADMALAKPMPAMQQMLFSAATRDPQTSAIVQRFLAGTSGTGELLSLRTLMRAFTTTVRHSFRRPPQMVSESSGA
ncbi:NAD(P)/FAD-dependent oxidoreductase [Dyella silvatica]|uniref:NAD(P)/FAD-dependent oxidoreductase n=1 Tax=Dyella silvatica TaxID=2992128 RepID=UPI002251CF20|nr:NAD(P)/FAD-dependent oxidoreductase [Dyella silvatica]